MEIFCSVCGISARMRSVSEVISPKGVIFACEKCVSEEGFPVLKKPDKKVFEEPERKGRVYDVMTRLSGVRSKEPERYELKKQEESLRKIIDRKYEEKMRMQDLRLKLRPDLIDKFHWIIMRVRRVRGLTQKQLAEMIGESEASIKMAEQGIVPEGYDFIDKLEGLLNVRLIKERNLYPVSSFEKRPSQPPAMGEKQGQQTHLQETLGFDRKSIGSLTIADLHRMKKEREAEPRNPEIEDMETEEMRGEEPVNKDED